MSESITIEQVQAVVHAELRDAEFLKQIKDAGISGFTHSPDVAAAVIAEVHQALRGEALPAQTAAAVIAAFQPDTGNSGISTQLGNRAFAAVTEYFRIHPVLGSGV